MVAEGKQMFDFVNHQLDGVSEDSDEKVVVVSYFGKSYYDASSVKAKGFKPMKASETEDPDSFEPYISGYFDSSQRIIHLHVEGVFDSRYLVNTLNKLNSLLEEKGYLTTWADLKHSYAKALLFIFSVSHIVVLCHPVPVFDLSYIHLFKSLSAIRLKALRKLSVCIKQVEGLSEHWYDAGRPCPPRLLFKFDSCPPSIKDVKKFQHNLEDQIYHILKKSKVITNASANSLFSIPGNEEFVFVSTKPNRPGNRLNGMINSLVATCLSQRGNDVPQFEALTVDYNMRAEQHVHSFDKFLSSHVEVALNKGFDDNFGRHLPAAPFALPTLAQFIEVSQLAYTEIMAPIPPAASEPTDEGNYVQLLRDHLDIDLKFSDARCGKVLPLAIAAYQDNSPFHYTREYHETKLSQAMSVLVMHGRGTMIEKYATQLEKECTRHWKHGHRMCQVLSLTGHPCANAIHKGGGDGAGGGEVLSDDEEDEEKNLEVKEHSSGLRYLSACNCGRRQGQRPDPYTLRAANYELYLSLAEECGCDELDHYRFPVFQPSTDEYKAAQLLVRRDSHSNKTDLVKSEQCLATEQDSSSLVYVSEQSGGVSDPRLSCRQSEGRLNDEGLVMQVSDHDIDLDKLARQPSTTEYLPGMLHTESPAGLLPQFTSWSLVCLGPSSLYSHNLGLQDQPGLLPGSSYLLPWDVTVRLEHQKKSPWSNADYRKQHSQLRLRKNKGDQSEFVVKIFVGIEYECPRGHRFMAAGPDKVLKTTNSGQVKDTGHRVTSTDMPLYFPCPCPQNKPLVGQLMRIHVVTPKAPVRVTLNPRVQPNTTAPIFIASHNQPIALSQSAYWVLRLPYVYMSDRVPILPPQEVTTSTCGRFLSGCYGITEIPPERS